MSDIHKARQLIHESTKEQPPAYIIEHDQIPGTEVLDYHGGAELMNIYCYHYDELDESAKEMLGKVFGAMKNTPVDLTKSTGALVKNKLKALVRKSDFNASQMRQMNRQIKKLTKHVLDMYYADLAALTNAHKSRGTLYTGPFFKELVNAFRLEPEVERLLKREFNNKIKEFLAKVKRAYMDYKDRNPDAPAPKYGYAYYQAMPILYRNKLRDEVNSLLGAIVKFAATNSVIQNFKDNPPEFTESYSLSPDDTQFLDRLHINDLFERVEATFINKEVNALIEAFQTRTEEKICEYLEGEDFTDEELQDDIEDVHETIYDQYVRHH